PPGPTRRNGGRNTSLGSVNLLSNIHVTRNSDQNDEEPNKRIEASPRMSALGCGFNWSMQHLIAN
ncbi:MAG: hypothetical protein ACE5FE_05345, partial [Acidiferrobacterales bacterium]